MAKPKKELTIFNVVKLVLAFSVFAVLFILVAYLISLRSYDVAIANY